ncbi:hypothetical protein KSP40_PGU019141 [Platanthera guangdongensis]|uniref:Uncharacterized protein n=1 Tax=Platanthera guangdongensis TaxID=2320717 RepID=A0ABR2N483_9ASPA
MTQLPLFRCQKHVSPAAADITQGGAASAAPAGRGDFSAASSRQCLSGCGGIGRRLVRKLKKQTKLLCAAAGGSLASGGGASFQCQYDPLSYSRNFDGGCALDEDSSRFYYTFSSRFARPLAASH